VHLVLGSQRVDLDARVLVVGRVGTVEAPAPGADLRWLPSVPSDAVPGDVPFGADAGSADEVRSLAALGAVAVGLAGTDAEALAAAVAGGLAVLVPAAAAAGAASQVPPERLVAVGAGAHDGPGVACLDLDDLGPAAWGRATVALSQGVRAVRTGEPRSIRRVATVVERLVAAGAGS